MIEQLNIYNKISDIISDLAGDKNMQRDIEEYLVRQHGMMRGTFLELISHSEKVNNLNHDELAVFMHAIYQISNNAEWNPGIYFDSKTLKLINDYIFDRPENITFPYTFSPVIKVTSEDFLTVISYRELAHLANSGLLTYNFDTQRLAKKSISKRTGKVIKKKDIKSKSVNSIMSLMRAGKYNPSTLLFNILVDGKSHLSFEDNELTIYEGSTLNIIDGAHRLEAIVRILEEDPNFEGFMNVDIKHYPVEKAQHLLAVTNTVNRFDKTLVKYYGGSEYGQEITKYLMTLPVLKDRIEIKTALSKGITITNFAILSEAIQSIFSPQNTKERYDIQDVLKKFYEYLIPSYEEELVTNRIKHLETSWFSHHNMHVGFIAIAKKLFDQFGKDFPVDMIVKVIDNIDFTKATSTLTNIMGGQGKVNSKKVKQMIREFIEMETDKIIG